MSRVFMTLEIRHFENILGKGENAGNQAKFLSSWPSRNCCLQTLSHNLVKSEILWSSKGQTTDLTIRLAGPWINRKLIYGKKQNSALVGLPGLRILTWGCYFSQMH